MAKDFFSTLTEIDQCAYLSLEHWRIADVPFHAGITLRKYPLQKSQYSFLSDHACVLDNRKNLAKAIKQPFLFFTAASQVHGIGLQWVTEANVGKGREDLADAFQDTDGLLTTLSHVVLTVSCADCVPVYIKCHQPYMKALVHAGWRGVAAGIVPKAFSMLIEKGASPEDIHVAVGPAIGKCCFGVTHEVAMTLGHISTQQAELVKIDLRSLIAEQLLSLGLDRNHLYQSEHCTVCSKTPLFHSHRRAPQPPYRMMAFLV